MRISLMILMMSLVLFATIGCEQSILKPADFTPDNPNQNPIFITSNLKASDGSFSVGYRNYRIRADRINLEWNPAADENFLCYRLYRGTQLIRTIDQKSNTAITDSLLNANTSYLYTIATVVKTGISRTDTLTVKTASVTAPFVFTRINQNHSIRVSWQDRADIPGNFELWINGTLQTTIAEASSHSHTYVYNYLYNDAQQFMNYQFEVRKVGMYDNSYTQQQNVYNNYVMNPPSLSADQGWGDIRVMLTWTDNSTSSTGYKIFRRIAGTSEFAMIASISNATTRYYEDDANLEYNTTYEYAIKALDYESSPPVETDYSNISSITLYEVLGVSYNFNNGQMPSEFLHYGNSYWTISPNTAKNFCLKSGSIGHFGESTVQIPLNIENAEHVQISFDYFVSSEYNYDTLRFYVDGYYVEEWSGEIGWTHYAYNLYNYSPNLIGFSYSKDGSYSAGMDCAMIDNIVITYTQNGKTHTAKLGDIK